jgi:hypothetical protein
MPYSADNVRATAATTFNESIWGGRGAVWASLFISFPLRFRFASVELLVVKRTSKLFFMSQVSTFRPHIYELFSNVYSLFVVLKRLLCKILVWRAGYTPADRLTSWVYSITLVQYLYMSCYISVNKPVLSYLLSRLLPHLPLFLGLFTILIFLKKLQLHPEIQPRLFRR